MSPSRSVTRPEFLAAGGAVGGYNRGWLDPGNHVMRVNGEPRTSIITTPNGQPPARKAGATAAPAPPPSFVALLGTSPTPRGGAFDNPESRGAGERCIVSFGRNGGPPMFANGFYNNNYQIVQSPNAVVIVVEMIHDARIVRLNSKHRTDDVRPYFGDSIGWWEGDTLVVETTNIPQSQQFIGLVEGPEGHRALHARRPRPAPLRLHGRGPDDVGCAVGRRVRVRRARAGAALRIRLPRGQLRPARHPRRRPRAGSRAAAEAAAEAKAKPGAKPAKGGQ